MSAKREIEIRTLFEPSPKKPILVCGLPGSGYVGKLAADYLVSALNARRFTEFRSNEFPPHVNVNDDGTAQVLKGELYHGETAQENDLLVFTADAQPVTSAGEYALSEAVLVEAKKRGAESVFSLAAYITGDLAKERKVFGTSTTPDLLQRLSRNGVNVMRGGGITGMNGVITGMAKLHGMSGLCLLGETSGYMIDPAASHSVLQALSRILPIRIDLTALLERAKEAQQVMNQIRAMSSQVLDEARGRDETRPGYIG